MLLITVMHIHRRKFEEKERKFGEKTHTSIKKKTKLFVIVPLIDN